MPLNEVAAFSLTGCGTVEDVVTPAVELILVGSALAMLPLVLRPNPRIIPMPPKDFKGFKVLPSDRIDSTALYAKAGCVEAVALEGTALGLSPLDFAI